MIEFTLSSVLWAWLAQVLGVAEGNLGIQWLTGSHYWNQEPQTMVLYIHIELITYWKSLYWKYRIAGNFSTVQIFAYFEHIQIVQKLEPMKILPWDDETTWFFLVWQLFVYYCAPDVPENMVGMRNHRLDGERSMHWVEKFELAQPGGVAWRSWKIWTLELWNFILMENSKLYKNMCQRKFPAIWYTVHINVRHFLFNLLSPASMSPNFNFSKYIFTCSRWKQVPWRLHVRRPS